MVADDYQRAAVCTNLYPSSWFIVPTASPGKFVGFRPTAERRSVQTAAAGVAGNLSVSGVVTTTRRIPV